jgi:hypothetical protein
MITDGATPTDAVCWAEGVPEPVAGWPEEAGADAPPPMKKTRAMTTTAMTPITAAMTTHGLSKGSFLLLMMLSLVQMIEDM